MSPVKATILMQVLVARRSTGLLSL